MCGRISSSSTIATSIVFPGALKNSRQVGQATNYAFLPLLVAVAVAGRLTSNFSLVHICRTVSIQRTLQ
jgi:hypothetical protein